MERKVGEEILQEFFYNYIITKDLSKIENLFSSKFKGIGTAKFEIANNKDEFMYRIKKQFLDCTQEKIVFSIEDYVEDKLEDIISAVCNVVFYFPTKDKKLTMRLSSVFSKENKEWKIINLHSSYPELTQKEEELFFIDCSVDAEKEQNQIFYLPDTFKKAFLRLSEINFLVYSRITRKVTFHLSNKESFDIRRNFSEIEEKLKNIESFYKLDRGTIVNLYSIAVIDYKEEKILFKNGSILYSSKLKLRELEERWYLLKNRDCIII